RLPGDGAPVAAVLPQQALLLHPHLEPRLREAGRGIWHPRLASEGSGGARGRPRAGKRSRRPGARRVGDRARGERLPDDPTRRLSLRADRNRAGGGGRLSHRMPASHTVAVLLDDALLTLNRAVGVLRRRNVLIECLALKPSGTAGVSELTFVLKADAAAADVVMMLVPDQEARAVYEAGVAAALGRGKTLLFAHGFNIHFGEIVPPATVDVAMIAPKSPGHMVRSEYQAGRGVPALVA